MHRHGRPQCGLRFLVTSLLLLPLLLPLSVLSATAAAESGVVPTDALPPEQQRSKFHLPPGFEIQLVVSEPEIGQPMNMNFDARGRLWLTHTIEYPYPAQGDVEPRNRFAGIGDHPPRDRLTVIEGIGADGQPAKVTHFADGLNIPIGVTPVGNGDEALVYSIPTIDRVTDVDADGKADNRSEVYGRFGNIDTHGMANSFTRWIDGWIYGCHGFANTSEIRDAEGNVVTMQSGNTYRFREDGSRFEQFTWGQVNPFGMTFDPWGNLYDSDCHSMPIYLLLRGAYYPSFGKPHDGLGFGPTMIDHGHGSTGICGPAFYAAEQFPAEYRGSVFICNPVNGQIHHDRLRQVGSTMLVDTQPDFVTCEDGWFRPVDLQVGPDGALYIADFYNSVIGHYEVPLEHPKRDRHHGRIWRVIYTGTEDAPVDRDPQPMLDLTMLSGAQLIEKLADPNLVVRTLATNWLVDSTAPGNASERIESLRKVISADASATNPFQRAHAIWALERLATLEDSELGRVGGSKSALVRTHLVRLLAERSHWSDTVRSLVLRATEDTSAMVCRVAADACGRHPHIDHLEPLFRLIEATPLDDTHLVHTAKIALRDQLHDSAVLASLDHDQLSDARNQLVAELLVSIKNAEAAAWTLAYLQAQDVNPLDRESLLRHAVRHTSDRQFASLVDWLRNNDAGDQEKQFRVLSLVQDASSGGASARVDPLRDWANALADTLWQAPSPRTIRWTSLPDPRATVAGDPWSREPRASADGDTSSSFWSSLPGGEQKMGTLQSSPFAIPDRLSFYIAGHNGITSQPEVPGNVVRLRDTVTGEILREAKPPRHDTAQRVEWNLRDEQPGTARIELVDGHSGSGYAWLAVGRFSLPELNSDAFDPRRAATELITQFDLQRFQPRLEEAVGDDSKDLFLRQRAALTLLHFNPDARLSSLLDTVFQPDSENVSLPPQEEFTETIFELVVSRDDAAIYAALEAMMERGSSVSQNRWAYQLSSGRRGGEALLRMIASGTASPRTIADPNVRNRLKTLKIDSLTEQLAEIEAAMPEEDEETLALIKRRTEQFSERDSSIERGAEIVRKQCIACHRIGSEGELVGPQLDGIGGRGVVRLVEDLLDPNRNVDPAFHATAFLTVDGRVISGLIRHEDETQLELVDQAGKKITLATDEIEERTRLNLSPMPANLGETLDEDAFSDLLAFLLTQQAKADGSDDEEN